MVKIRLARIGRRNSPYYRIVVSDSRRTPHAESLDDLGHYDLSRERTLNWSSTKSSLSSGCSVELSLPIL